MVIVGNCKKLFENAERKISDVVENTTENFEEATKIAGNMICKNILFSFITSIILVAATIGAYLYVQNYRDGTKIAQAKAVEALAKERLKFEEEIAVERTKLEKNLEQRKKEIEVAAIESYKNSKDFVIDGATYVANNFFQWRILETFYLEMPIEQKKDLGLHNWLIECHKEYKKKYGKKSPREL